MIGSSSDASAFSLGSWSDCETFPGHVDLHGGYGNVCHREIVWMGGGGGGGERVCVCVCVRKREREIVIVKGMKENAP